MLFVNRCFSLWRLMLIFALSAITCVGTVYAFDAPVSGVAVETRQVDIEVFVREGCPHCAHAKQFLTRLQAEQPELKIVIRDVIQEPAAMARLKQISGQQMVRIPAFWIGGKLLVGYSDEASTGQLIRNSLVLIPGKSDSSASCGIEPSCNAPPLAVKPETYSVDFIGNSLSPERVGLPLFTLAMGLLDGFNPCSMWVLILMISLLAPMNNRSRMVAIAGTFVAVEGVIYFLFMATWLNVFLLIGLSRSSEIIIALLAIMAGAINLKDFVGIKSGVSLSIPLAARPGIYARMRRVLQAENLSAALIGTVILALLVQMVEFMCTSGFPALFTRILTLHEPDRVGYYGYLILYDLAYMLDDMIVLAIGVITLSQRRLQEQEGRMLKLLSGVVMLGLGVYLFLQ